jgi:hypothetical protein
VAEVSADDISLINNNSGPFILLGTRTVLDSPPGGNNNGRFDPGENGSLLLALRNIGNQGVNNVTALLRSTDPRFVIADSTTSYGSIPACSTRINSTDPFRVQVDPSIPKETPIQLMLLVNGTGYCDTIYFRLVVGEVVMTDPVPDGPRQPPLYWAYDDVDSSYVQHPEFSWVEINNLGTRLNLSDDQTVQIDLPFTWQFYSTNYNQISICSNGWVAPGYTTATAYYNSSLPTTTLPGVVCANWDDLYPPYGNGVWYFYDTPNHRFVVEWDSVYYLGGSQWDKFEIIIYDQTIPTPTGDNQLIVQYLTANNYSSSTVGIQDPTQTIAIQCLFDGSYHHGSARLLQAGLLNILPAHQPQFVKTATKVRCVPDFMPSRILQPLQSASTLIKTPPASSPSMTRPAGSCARFLEKTVGNGMAKTKTENRLVVASTSAG